MWHDTLRDARFFRALVDIDRDLAEQTRQAGCPCGGRMHSARYPRKPRGGPPAMDEDFRKRFSFCCDQEGCRQRVTPPSVRFLSRRVYLGAVVVLVSAMLHGVTEKRVNELKQQVSPTLDARTLRRWRVWWCRIFVQTPFWKQARARLAPPVEPSTLPASLLERFPGDIPQRLQATLQFLAPLSTRTSMAA